MLQNFFRLCSSEGSWSWMHLVSFVASQGLKCKFTSEASQDHQLGAEDVMIRICNESNNQSLLPNCLLLDNCLMGNMLGSFQKETNIIQGAEVNSSKILIDQVIVNQIWRNRIQLYFLFWLQEKKQYIKGKNVQMGDISIIRYPNVMKCAWEFCWVVEVYPDEKETTKDVKITITPLDKLIKFRDDSNMIRMDADSSVIIGPRGWADLDMGHKYSMQLQSWIVI